MVYCPSEFDGGAGAEECLPLCLSAKRRWNGGNGGWAWDGSVELEKSAESWRVSIHFDFDPLPS